MDFRESREGDVVVIWPDGSLAGAEETSALESKLAAVQKAGARQFVIDCSGVGQLTSAAIRVLLLTTRKLGRSQGRLVLCGMNAKVRKAFAISGFDKDFTILATREEAVQRVVEAVVPADKARRVRPPSPGTAEPGPVPAAEPATPNQPEALAAPSQPAPPVPPEPGREPAGTRHADDAGRVSGPATATHAEQASRLAGEPDPRQAQANALLDALGVRVLRPATTGSGGARAELEMVADALLSALGARR
jgi:anti-anti-sigma factor